MTTEKEAGRQMKTDPASIFKHLPSSPSSSSSTTVLVWGVVLLYFTAACIYFSRQTTCLHDPSKDKSQATWGSSWFYWWAPGGWAFHQGLDTDQKSLTGGRGGGGRFKRRNGEKRHLLHVSLRLPSLPARAVGARERNWEARRRSRQADSAAFDHASPCWTNLFLLTSARGPSLFFHPRFSCMCWRHFLLAGAG